MPDERPFELTSAGLRLEARLHEGDPGRPSWVVLHPHPQYGGDMHNHVVLAISEALAGQGCTTLRLNFRGTGGSGGAYEGGPGERLDALAAVEALRELGADRVGVAGYSFGAAIAAAVAQEAAAHALILVSPPALSGALQVPGGIPALAITGDRDAVSPAGAVQALAGAAVAVEVVAGADHGWWPGVEALKDLIAAFDPA